MTFLRLSIIKKVLEILIHTMKQTFTLFIALSIMTMLNSCVKERTEQIHFYDERDYGGVDVTKGLMLNEVCNRSCTYPDELNQKNPDHWVEVYNVTEHDIHLDDTPTYYITGSPGASISQMYKLSHFTVPAHSALVIFGDDSNQVTSKNMHANFHISKKGGNLGLYKLSGGNLVTLSTYHYDSIADISKGSSRGVYFNGSNHWQMYPSPTPGMPNPHP